MSPDTLEILADFQLLESRQADQVCRSLIRDFQKRRIDAGGMSSRVYLPNVTAGLSEKECWALPVNEAALGLDSLALLDLVMELTEFFGLKDSGIEDYLFVRRHLGEWAELIATHFEKLGRDASITFKTSGSQGDAKRISTNCIQLHDEVTSIADDLCRAAGRAPVRILSAVAPHHIYGFLWGVLLPRQLGCRSLDLFGTSPQNLERMAREGDLILATPYLWEKFAEADLHLPPGCSGVSSGGPSSETTWNAARDLGVDAFLDVFGSTETGGIGVRRQMDAPYALMTHLQRSGDDVLRRRDGTLAELQDRLKWGDDNSFDVMGRRDRVVQVAGTNVNLDEVEQTILQTKLAREVALRVDGGRLKAFVVPSEAADDDVADRIVEALAVLPSTARPDRIAYGDALPVTETGKARDWD